MKNNTNVSESVMGWFYLVFHLFLLPHLMEWANTKLPTPLSTHWMCLISYGISFVALLMICHGFIAAAGTNMTKGAPNWLRAVALGFCIYYTCDGLLDLFMSGWHDEYVRVPDATLQALVKLDFLPMAAGAIFLVPFVEEILFRGLVFRTVFNQHKALGYLVSTVVFAFLQIAPYMADYEPFTLCLCFLQFVPAGFTLSWTYANSDNILAPIFIHMIMNGLAVYKMG